MTRRDLAPIMAVSARCPVCDSPVRERRSRSDGRLFVGCAGYPRCKWAGPADAHVQALASEVVELRAHIDDLEGAGAITARAVRAVLAWANPDRWPDGKVPAHELAVRLADLVSRARSEEVAA